MFDGQLSLTLCVSSCLLFACFSQFAVYVCCTMRVFVMLLTKGYLLTYLFTYVQCLDWNNGSQPKILEEGR